MHDRIDDFRIAMPDVENAETAEAIDVLFAVDVAIRIRACIGPFDGCGSVVDGRGLAVLEKSGIDVIAKRLNGFARDPSRFVLCDLGFSDKF